MKIRRSTDNLTTEGINPRTRDIDRGSSVQIIKLISEEDKEVAEAVSRERKNIAKAVDLIVEGLGGGGRLIFLWAGTSGRPAVLEAAECPPTFGTDLSAVEEAGGSVLNLIPECFIFHPHISLP